MTDDYEIFASTAKGWQQFKIKNGRRIWMERPTARYIRDYDHTPSYYDAINRLVIHD